MQHTPLDELQITREPHNHYGSLEDMLRQIRAHRPLDLNAERWHEAHPEAAFTTWREQAHQCLLEGLHCDPGAVDLQPEVLDREDRPGYTLEHVAFNNP